MSDYNWCHGPECHTQQTQSRVRGSGTNKVLRTRRIKAYQGKSMFGNGGGNIWDYFDNITYIISKRFRKSFNSSI